FKRADPNRSDPFPHQNSRSGPRLPPPHRCRLVDAPAQRLRFDPGSQAPPLRSLNLSGNRFASVAGLPSLPCPAWRTSTCLGTGWTSSRSGWRISEDWRRLDLSHNSMRGVLPEGFPPIAGGLGYLDVPYNNFTGALQPERRRWRRAGIIRVALWYYLYRVEKEEQRTRGEKEGGAAAVGDLAGGAVQKVDEADVEVREGVSTGKRQAPQPHA
ncbi:hypothetical protein BHE74_00056959, partial [Ensete ventricosum]